MLVTKLYRVRSLVLLFVQVPDLEVFVLVDSKELAQTRVEVGVFVSEVLDTFELVLVFFVDVDVFKIEQAPFNLSNRVNGLVVPDGNGGSEALIEESTEIWVKLTKNTYAIEPQE